MMNLKKILNKEATWYFLTLAGLLILLYMGGNIIHYRYAFLCDIIKHFDLFIFLYSRSLKSPILSKSQPKLTFQ